MAQKQNLSRVKGIEQSRPQFYRRKLPETCISFSSDEGKKIFTEAINSGHMDCYFKLAAQFRTQDEPAFCGLSTLVMVLNALEIDPEKVWKSPWRWYHENMLDCCAPVKVIEQEGITFGQFICLAECNGLETNPTYVDENASLQSFRNDIIRYTKQDDSVITLSYSREVLKQTGDGHFSPVAGYHPDRDMVLMMDTARFKYPPHWIPLPLLFESMQAKDKTTGKSRGYVMMRKQAQGGLLLFRISSFGVTLKNGCSESMRNMLNSWKAWLCQSIDTGVSVEQVIGNAVECLLKASCLVPAEQHIFTTQLDIKCTYDISDEYFCVLELLILELEKTKVFEIVTEALRNETSSANLDIFGSISGATSISSGETAVEKTCKRRCLKDLQPTHFLAVFLLSWPYHSVAIPQDTNAYLLNEYVCKTVISADAKNLGTEVQTLQKQFTAMLVSSNARCGNACLLGKCC